MTMHLRAAAAFSLLAALAFPLVSVAQARKPARNAVPAVLQPAARTLGGRKTTSRGGNRRARSRRANARVQAPSPITMHIAAGYAGHYRQTSWMPVRVTVHNKTSATITASVQIPQSATTPNSGPQAFRTVYSAPVILPAGGTKRVTIFVPGYTSNGEEDVRVVSSTGRRLASDTAWVNQFGYSDAVVGALTDDPGNIQWLSSIVLTNSSYDVVRLTPATVDPFPDALQMFDVIVLTDTDTGQLDSSQRDALRRYVELGGSLLLVGGPNAAATLKPLPADLVPGALGGVATLPDLGALSAWSGVRLKRSRLSVSVLRDPVGHVLVRERGVPLVVQQSMGQGQILYLAFDPADAPIQGSHAATLLSRLVMTANPYAASRTSWPGGYQAPSPFQPRYGPFDITSELANVPAAALPSIVLFIILTVAYVLLLGPANFAVLRRFRRRELAWVTIPILAVLCVASTFAVALRLKGTTVLLNTAGVVLLDGTGPHPASFYVGLFAPVQGDYHLAMAGDALPSAIPQYYYYGPGPNAQQNQVGLAIDERGSSAQVTFEHMNMWSMRDVAVDTSVNVPGRIVSHLHIAADGSIRGTIHNGTRLRLLRPMVVTPSSHVAVHDLAPGATARIHVTPLGNVYNYKYLPVWFSLYGRPSQYGGPYINRGIFGSGVAFSGPMVGAGPCCYGSTPIQEKSLIQRLRNVAAAMPDAYAPTTLADLTLVAWTEQPLSPLTVDGATPRRRDLTMIEAPLSVQWPSAGRFQLRTGTLSPTLVDTVPVSQTNNCCYVAGTNPIFIGYGGYATFEFDIPNPGHTHFHSLHLWLNAGGVEGQDIGRVYDVRKGQWDRINLETGEATLKDPARYISPSGALLLKLVGTDNTTGFNAGPNTGTISIADPRVDIQLSGEGTVT